MRRKSNDYQLTQKNRTKLEKFLGQHNLPDLLFIQGFLAAVISSPTLTLPEEWMGYLGFEDTVFQSMKQNDIDRIIINVLSIYNDIYAQFDKGKFEIPLSESSSLDQKKQWAKGYMEVVGWDQENWFTDDQIATLLFPILSLTAPAQKLQVFMDQHDIVPTKLEKIHSCDILSLTAKTIYYYWLSQHEYSDDPDDEDDVGLPPRYIKPGRNDPCYCGSGKKYKKCCLVTEQVVYH